MKRFLPLLCLPVLALAQDAQVPAILAPKLERFDPAFDQIIAPEAKLEKLDEGFQWSEGPVWKDGALYFSDVPQNKMYRLVPGQKAQVFLQPSGGKEATPTIPTPGSNGMTVDGQKRLVVCQQGPRRVIVLEKDKKQIPIADLFRGKHFNSPNDVIVARNHDIYFTDPPYGFPELNNSPLKELPFNGVFRVNVLGEVSLVIKDLTFPNGLAFSPDEKILYIAVSDPDAPKVYAYDLQPDGKVTNRRLFFDSTKLITPERVGLPDGMKVDIHGNVFICAAGGVLVVSPEGKHLGTIVTGQQTGNCNWGDDGSTLYICANMFITRIKTLTKGSGW
jgi:gluconolactonase